MAEQKEEMLKEEKDRQEEALDRSAASSGTDPEQTAAESSGGKEASGPQKASNGAEKDPADSSLEEGRAEAESSQEDEEELEDGEDVMDGEWTSAEGGDEDAGIKGFFKKNKKDKKDIQIEELTDRVRRQMAEFDNFRKRTEKEKASMYEVGARSVIEKILPVVDNFERGLASAEEGDPFAEGMQKIYKQLLTTLEALEVKPIEAVGQPFNPDLHNAVMHVDDDSVGENIVVEELQKGYLYRDNVVRYSMVKVAN